MNARRPDSDREPGSGSSASSTRSPASRDQGDQVHGSAGRADDAPPGDGAPPAAEDTHADRDEASGRGATGRRRGGDRPRKKALPLWQEVIVLLAMALLLAIVVKALFVQAFFVPSGSMEPQFVQGDRILVEKVSYWNDDVHRGDVIVFDDPGGWLGAAEGREADGLVQRGLEAVGLYPTGGHLVKRVIGVGGDHVVCCDSRDRVTVNGVALDEGSYLQQGVQPSETPFDVTVPPGSLWVMGDNRLESGDSRVHVNGPGKGFVPAEDVVGKVWAIVWPLGRTEILNRPGIYDNPALDGS